VSNALIIRAPNAMMLPPQQPRSLVHGFSLALVWLSVASGAIVLTEPAPVDLLTMALIVLLPIVGLVTIRPPLVVFLAVWLLAAAGAFISSITALDVARSTIHSVISVYLYSAAFVFAAFIVKRPEAHTRLILNAYQWAAVIAATTAMIGYFDLLPATKELFTKFDRASGTFKDPNVFAPFLVPALIGTLHQIVTRPLHRAILPAAIWLFLALALFLSYSRGAWINFGLATAIYGYFSFVFAPTNRQRLKMIALGLLGAFAVVVALVMVLQNDTISRQFDNRAAVSQSYDEGPDGRFGGHVKARNAILDNPWGIGAGTFTETLHPEDVHHVYLSMFLNAGWIGGLVFALMTLATVAFGLRHLFRRTVTRPLFLIAYAAFVAVAFEGFVVDIDHWRHFYLLMAIIWGLMIGDRRIDGRATTHVSGPNRPPRIIRRVDMLIIRPSRPPRIIGRLPRRHGRIVGPAKRRRDNRIVGPARRQLTDLPVIPRRELIERPRRPDRIVYR
jgi:O-antigen ligase